VIILATIQGVILERKLDLNKYLSPLLFTSLLISQGSAISLAQQAIVTPAQQPAPATADVPPVAQPAAPAKVVLAEGTDVALTFDQDLSSKTAAEGDPVECVLAEDIKVGDVVVARAGAKAIGEVTNAKKAGMMGKAGELNIRLDYLKVGSTKIKLRGSKGKEGESGTTSAIVLTVLFGPIGLIKHGHNIDIKKGTALKVYVGDDISLAPVV
jgi:glucose/arabinose dehydrogenase